MPDMRSYKLGHQRLSSFFAFHYKNTPIWDRGRQITLRGGLPDVQEPGLTLRGIRTSKVTRIQGMLGFLRLRAWDAQREKEKKKPRQRFIDEVWPGVKPG